MINTERTNKITQKSTVVIQKIETSTQRLMFRESFTQSCPKICLSFFEKSSDDSCSVFIVIVKSLIWNTALFGRCLFFCLSSLKSPSLQNKNHKQKKGESTWSRGPGSVSCSAGPTLNRGGGTKGHFGS